jgi:hypothetical protein
MAERKKRSFGDVRIAEIGRADRFYARELARELARDGGSGGAFKKECRFLQSPR